jgi:hypothetical protein
MSRPSRLTLIASCTASAGMIAYVHWWQHAELAAMDPMNNDQGLERGDDALKESRLRRWRQLKQQLPQ